MKKRIAVFIGILCFLSGCGSKGNSVETENKLAKAYELYELGEYEDAKNIFQQYTEMNACKETALIGFGKCNAAMGMTEDALTAYNVVLNQNPENRSCRYDRAILYEQIGDKESAYGDYNKLYEMDHEDQFAWNKVEEYLKENGLLEELLAKYQEKKEEGDEQALVTEIELLVAMGSYEEVPSVVNQFENEDFRQLCMKQWEAYVSMQQGDVESAKDILCSGEKFMTEDMVLKSVYIGEHNDVFQRDGRGILITDEYPNTQIYIGEWKENKREGNGCALNAYTGEYEGGELYFRKEMLEGIWKDDLPNGACTITKIYEEIENEGESYRQQTSYSINFTDGVANGELIIEERNETPYGNETYSEKYMIEDGESVAFTDEGKEVYSITYDKNGNVEYVNDSWRNGETFKWDVY